MAVTRNNKIPSPLYAEIAVPIGVAATSGILGMGSVPVDLLPAPGANKYYKYHGVIEYTHDTTAYVLAANDAIVVGSYSNYSGTYIQENLIANPNSAVAFFSGGNASDEFTAGTDSAYETILNDPLQMFTWNAADPTTGNGTMLVKIWYEIKTMGTEL